MAIKQTDLEPIEQEAIIARYIKFAIESKEKVQCFIKETEIRFDTLPLVYDATEKKLSLSVKNSTFSPESVREKVNNTDERIVSISFKTDEIFFFARCKLSAVIPNGIILKLTTPIYKLQRRKNQRFRPSADNGCIVHWHAAELEVTDISAGGISILMNDKLAQNLEVGQIQSIKLTFASQCAEVQASVKNKNEVPSSKSAKNIYKVGMQFISLPATLEHEIARAAYAYTQRIYSRKI